MKIDRNNHAFVPLLDKMCIDRRQCSECDSTFPVHIYVMAV